MASDLLLEFFASLSTEADLRGLITENTKENLHLEFKGKKDRSKPDLDESDAWQFSRALSGFANSAGGVLLWGIETGKGEQAKKLKPISGVAEFEARLKKSLLNSTQPIVEGVQINVIPASDDASAGYVACFIPESNRTPHRAMLADREYYKRSTEGFYRLEHFDLEDMFGRRPTPRLAVRISLHRRGSSGGGGRTEYKGHVVIAIENTGRGSARAPYLTLETHAPYDVDRHGLDGNGHEGLARILSSDPRRHVYGGSLTNAVHPRVVHDVCAIQIIGNYEGGRALPPAPLRAKYSLGADNFELVDGVIELTGEQIAAAVSPDTVYRPREA